MFEKNYLHSNNALSITVVNLFLVLTCEMLIKRLMQKCVAGGYVNKLPMMWRGECHIDKLILDE